MNTDIFDVDKFVNVNNLREVTNPITLDRGNIPSADGLLSTEIFGRTPDDRKNIFAYIDLHEHFFHPIVYKNLLRLDRRIENIISGSDRYKVTERGELVQDENGETGLPFLYKNFEKIKFKDSTSTVRKDRINLLKSLKKNEIFLDKVLVCPAFYRDINLADAENGKVSVGDINKLYANIIRYAKALQYDTHGLDMVSNSTRNMVQKAIVDIYDYFMHEVKGKNGMFRKFVLGVSVDFGARLVISSNRFQQDKHDEMLVDFYHCGLPLATTCVNFYPFVLKWIKDLFYNEFYLKQKKSYLNRKTGEIEIVEVKNPENLVSDEFIVKALDSFIHSYADRFKVIKVPTTDGKEMVISIQGYYQTAKGGNATSSTLINRPATWTDILYMACVDVVKDKHVMITRYPVNNIAA